MVSHLCFGRLWSVFLTSYLNFSVQLLNCLSVIIFFNDFLLILMPKILIKKVIRIGLLQRLTLCYLEKKVEQREMGIGTLVVSSVLRILRVQSTYLTLTKKGVDLNCQLRTKMGTL